MAVEINNNAIIDDDRNLLEAETGTFLQKLSVGTLGSLMRVEPNVSATDNILSVRDASDLSIFEIAYDGKIGIGTSNPSESLDVVGTGFRVGLETTEIFSVEAYTPGSNANILDIFDTEDNLLFSITPAVGGYGAINIADINPLKIFPFPSDPRYDLYVGTESVLQLASSANTSFTNTFSVLNSSNQTIFAVTPGGNIGVGVENPTVKFHIDGGQFLLTQTGNEIFSVSTTGNNLLSITNNTGGAALDVTSTGKVGVGISSPVSLLDLRADAGESDLLKVFSGGAEMFSVSTNGTNLFSILDNAGGAALDVTTSGKIGIGTSTPTSVFEVQVDTLESNILKIASGVTEIFKIERSGGSSAQLSIEGILEISAGVLVTNLPTSPDVTVGMVARVTDANTPAIGSTVAGLGGSNALCWYNGTNWTVLGV